MQLTRNNFGAESLVVLDQVAKLLYLAEQALELIRTFENNPHKGAARSMRVIVEFANKASSNLMEALFHAESKRSIALTAAIDFAQSNVQSAIAAAKKLAIMEQARTEHSGTVISHGVLPILELLHNEWASVSTKAG